MVHEWPSRYTPTFGVHVLANGNLLRAGHDPNNPFFIVGGQGGIVQEIAWDGTVVWEFVYSNRQHVQHHDIEPLPNGNVLMLAWERKTAHEAVLAGRDPQMDKAIEVLLDQIKNGGKTPTKEESPCESASSPPNGTCCRACWR